MARKPQGHLRIGISGWTYPPWRKIFYPEDLPQRRELEFASRQMNSIEINGTFYSLQKPESFEKWRDATPDDFLFSIKGSRYLTHMLRLTQFETPLANFFGSGVLKLGKKLGPFLWQFPPSFKYRRDRLEEFFIALPRDTEQASRLARKHDDKIKGRASINAIHDGPLRHAIEIRHPSFEDEDFIGLLREHDVALVIADTAGKWPFMEDVTSDFIYIRLHGAEELYASGYTPESLDGWAAKIRSWAKGGRDVYVYFDNDIKVHAPFDAISLSRRLGLKEPEKVRVRPH